MAVAPFCGNKRCPVRLGLQARHSAVGWVSQSTNAACQVNILDHDGHTFRVNSTQISVKKHIVHLWSLQKPAGCFRLVALLLHLHIFEEVHQIRFCGLLQRAQCSCLPSKSISGKIECDFANLGVI